MSMSSRRALPPALNRLVTATKMLSAEREHELLQRYHATGDAKAMNELVRSHMPIIVRAASKSAMNPGVDINDLVQTATEGLLIAINRWSFSKSEAAGARFAASSGETPAEGEPTEAELEPVADAPRASRLATYAMWWMRMLLTDTVIESRGMVVRAKGVRTRKALFGLPAAMKALDISRPISSNDVVRIAAHLGLEVRDVEEALSHAAGDVMLDEPVGESGTTRGDITGDERAEGEEGILARLSNDVRWNAVCDALMALSPRERFIVLTRYLLNPRWKLDRLSDTLKMSRERIRQIGDDALATVRRAMTSKPPKVTEPGADTSARAIEAMVIEIERVAAEPALLADYIVRTGIGVGPSRVTTRRAIPAVLPPTSIPLAVMARPVPHYAQHARF